MISRRRSLSFSHLLQNVETVVGRIANLLGAAVVGLIVLVVLTLVLAAVVGTFVLDAGADVENNVQAGVSVSGDAETNEITVTWTSNQNAEHLLVEWSASGVTVEATGSSGDASVDDEQARLSSVGSAVTLTDGESGSETAVQVTVTAVNEDDSTVVLSREVTV